jgi:hypothetical protein
MDVDWELRQAGPPDGDFTVFAASPEAMAVAIVAGLAHDGDDLINGRRVRGVVLAVVAPGDPGAESWRGRRRAASSGSVEQLLNRRHGSLL